MDNRATAAADNRSIIVMSRTVETIFISEEKSREHRKKIFNDTVTKNFTPTMSRNPAR